MYNSTSVDSVMPSDVGTTDLIPRLHFTYKESEDSDRLLGDPSLPSPLIPGPGSHPLPRVPSWMIQEPGGLSQAEVQNLGPS